MKNQTQSSRSAVATSNSARPNHRKMGRRALLVALGLVAIGSVDLTALAQNEVARTRASAIAARGSAVQAARLVTNEMNARGRSLKRNHESYETRGSDLWKQLQEKDPRARRYGEAQELLMEAAMILGEAGGKLSGLPELVKEGDKLVAEGDQRISRGDRRLRIGQAGTAKGHYRIARENYLDALKKYTKVADGLDEVAAALTKSRNKLNAAEAIIRRLPAAPAGGPMPTPAPAPAPAPEPAPGPMPMPGDGMMP